MSEIPKSENVDEFLKRNNLKGQDEVLNLEEKPTINLSDIPAYYQPKEKGSSSSCDSCDKQ